MERMAELGKTIHNAKGIDGDFRQRLIAAYESPESQKELPHLIEEHSDLIAPTLFPTLCYLAKVDNASKQKHMISV